ncbi:hypothetical protein ACQR16_34035 [Bradyrhizobium oligotrophicum]|uniref:hypothetical protein n=1 Tax=Bradyrhizobium oligotrophicum TaxID=44255 RepID=UPI003EBAC3B4
MSNEVVHFDPSRRGDDRVDGLTRPARADRGIRFLTIRARLGAKSYVYTLVRLA